MRNTPSRCDIKLTCTCHRPSSRLVLLSPIFSLFRFISRFPPISSRYHDVSVGTLKFGVMCKRIKNRARANRVKDSKTLLREYRLKIASLSQELVEQQHTAKEDDGWRRQSDLSLTTEQQVALGEAKLEAEAEKTKRESLEKRIDMMKNMFLMGGTRKKRHQSTWGAPTGGVPRMRRRRSVHSLTGSTGSLSGGSADNKDVPFYNVDDGAGGGADTNAMRSQSGKPLTRKLSIIVTNDDHRLEGNPTLDDDAGSSSGYDFRLSAFTPGVDSPSVVSDKDLRRVLTKTRRRHEAAVAKLQGLIDSSEQQVEVLRSELSERCDTEEAHRNVIAGLREQFHEQ